jgi:hemerythrin-like metal-binding protein
MNNAADPTLLVWDKRYLLGIKSFDDQHHQLLFVLNELFTELSHDAIERERLVVVAKELVDFTVYSLDYEADCLAQFKYSDLLLHLEQHELFKEKTNWFKSKLDSNNITQTQLVLTVSNLWRFLYLWLNDHIVVCDKKFTDLMLQNGMK